ncbi:hypothetical protein GCM10027063_00170 [Promicromonospora xylanilytica]
MTGVVIWCAPAVMATSVERAHASQDGCRRASERVHPGGGTGPGVDLDPLAAAQFEHTPTNLAINRKTDGTTTYDR